MKLNKMPLNKYLFILLVLIVLVSLSVTTTLVQAHDTASPSVAPSSTIEASLVLTSPVFTLGNMMPVKYTQQGDNVSPPLSWNRTPEGTQSFALVCEDIDGPSGIITHWIIFNIPGDTLDLTEAVPVQDQLPNGALQGNNVRNTRGYIGPAPPAGTTHRYEFTLFALDRMLSLNAGVSRADLINGIQGHILAVGQTMAIYQRQ
jgi:Raf kinase inhibitor-like YbhB/YbcL family protein